MAKIMREEIVIENTVCIEDVKFTLLWDMGIIELKNPEHNYFYNQNYNVPVHSHKHYEMNYTTNGFEIIYDDTVVNYEPGTLVVVPPGKKHAQRRTAKRSQKFHNHSLQFCMKKIPVSSDIPLFDILTKLFENTYAQKCPERAVEIISSLDRESNQTIANDKIAISLALHELITIILKSAGNTSEIHPNKKISDSDSTRAYKIQMMLSNNYDDDITVEYVAKKLGLSTRQVTRIIKSVYGKPFKELVIERRMNIAARLLVTTNKNITEIASTVGYNASKGFYNTFKKYYGCLPTEYRKKNSEGNGQ